MPWIQDPVPYLDLNPCPNLHINNFVSGFYDPHPILADPDQIQGFENEGMTSFPLKSKKNRFFCILIFEVQAEL